MPALPGPKVACLQLDPRRQPFNLLLVNKNRTGHQCKSANSSPSVRFFADQHQAKGIVMLQIAHVAHLQHYRADAQFADSVASQCLFSSSPERSSPQRTPHFSRTKKVGLEVWNVLESLHLNVRLAPIHPDPSAPPAVVTPWRPRVRISKTRRFGHR